MAEGSKKIAENRKARFDYFIEDSIECGIALEGTEVKCVKAGQFSFPDAFAEIINGEVWVKGLHISEYSYSSVFNHNPDRSKSSCFIASKSSAFRARLTKRATH